MSVNIKKHIWIAFTWLLILVLFGIFLSPPALFIREFLGIQLSVEDMPVRATLYIHSAAVVFTALMAFFLLELFKVDPFIEKLVILMGTAGYFITSISAIIYAYFARHPIPHGIFVFGLSLSFIALLALVYEFFPKGKEKSATRATMFIMLILMTITVIIGAIYGSNKRADLLATVLWERTLVAHLHTTLVIIPMAIVIMIVEKYKLLKEGTQLTQRVTLYGLWAATIGALFAVVANYLYIWWGPDAHQVITPASSVVLLGSLMIMMAAFKKLIKEKNLSLSGFLITEPLKAGLLFVLFWVNIVVAIPGVWVAINIEHFRQPHMKRVAEAFEHGHYHMLALLSAIVLMFLIIDHYPINDKIKRWVGYTGTFGYILATGFTVPYMFINPDPYNHFTLPFIDTGLATVTLSIVLAYYGYTLMIRDQK